MTCTVTGGAMTELLTPSRLRCAQRCSMEHHLHYRVRLEPVSDDQGEAPRFGSLFHLGQETYWRALLGGTPDAERMAAALTTSLDAIEADGAGSDEYERAKARALMAGYHARWAMITPTWRVVAVEVEFRTPLYNPRTGRRSRRYDRGGKIDLIVELTGGLTPGLYVVEHKTSTEDIGPGSLYFEKLRLDDQCTIYLDGARSLGHEVRGVIYDVIRRPQQSPRKATPEEVRRYTKGVGCKDCGGGRAKRGTGLAVTHHDDVAVKLADHCPTCEGSGWKDAPRLDSRQREQDETPAEYHDRIFKIVTAERDKYFRRPPTPIIRLEDELMRMRQNIWNHANQLITDGRRDWHPLSTNSCVRFFRLCGFFPVCTGDADPSDPNLYQIRKHTHRELSEELQNGKASGGQETASHT